MKYITGIHALNLNCSLDTFGDWHQSALRWDKIKFNESRNSFFGAYGLEVHDDVPENPGEFIVANHIRALLDLLLEGNFAAAQGMNDYFIGNPKYNNEIFSKVMKMKDLTRWDKIKLFMFNEYGSDWAEELQCAGEKFEIEEFAEGDEFVAECLKGLSILEIERIIQRKCLTVSKCYFKVKNLVELIKLFNLYKNEISKESMNNIFSSLEYARVDRIKCILENSKSTEYDSEKVLKDLEQLCDEIGLRLER